MIEKIEKLKFIKLPKSSETGKELKEFESMLGHVYRVYYSKYGKGYVVCGAEDKDGIKAFNDAIYRSLVAIGEGEEFAEACAYKGEDPGMALYFEKECFGGI